MAGYSWDDCQSLCARKTVLSATRGLGPSRQSAPLLFNDMAELTIPWSPVVPAGHLREIEASSTPRDNVAPRWTRSARSTVQRTCELMHGTCVRCLCSSPLVCMLSVFNVVCWLRFCLAFAHCTPVRGCFSVAHLTCLSGAWESSWRRTLRGHDLKGHRVGSVRALCLASSTRTRCWVHTSTTLPLASSVSWVTHLWRLPFLLFQVWSSCRVRQGGCWWSCSSHGQRTTFISRVRSLDISLQQ